MNNWIVNDITWCASDCDKTWCYRHQSNLKGEGIYSFAEFKDTDICESSQEYSKKEEK